MKLNFDVQISNFFGITLLSNFLLIAANWLFKINGKKYCESIMHGPSYGDAFKGNFVFQFERARVITISSSHVI